jgi:hypothetical protein
MTTIQTLSTPRGRSVLRDVFRELRYEKQVSGFTALLTCWRLCAFEREIFRYSRFAVSAQHALGIVAGTSLWMREIVNRFYFSTINSLVYLGAALLLLVIALYRFSDVVDVRYVIGSVFLESFMLFMLFVVMFFSPADDVELEQDEPETDDIEDEYVRQTKQLIEEVGEISADYAAFTDKMSDVTAVLASIAERQDALTASIQDLVSVTTRSLSPTPEFTTVVNDTNRALQDFTGSVRSFVHSAEALHRDEIQRAIQREVERILALRIQQGAMPQSSVQQSSLPSTNPSLPLPPELA